MTKHVLLSVLTGQPQPTPAKSGLTGHFKTPVQQAEIGALGLVGDHIMDLENHGGVDQAVYIFGDMDRVWWAKELDRPVPPGFFGENLLVCDLETGPLASGDLFQIGYVTLEITAPRIPCATYAAHIGFGQAVRQFYGAGRPGAYARVISPGTVRAGDPAALTPFSGDRVTVAEIMAQYRRKFDDAAFLARLRDVPAHHKLHEMAARRLGAA